MFPPKSCPPCNCWNETQSGMGEIPDGQYHPCCDAVADAPCIYAVLFGCDHSWPVITDVGGGDQGYYGLPCNTLSEWEPPKFFYQVHRLKKECGQNCLWSEVHIVNLSAGNEVCRDMIDAKMVPCDLETIYFPNDQHTFPQYQGPPLEAVRACYAEYFPADASECYSLAVDEASSTFRFWSLNLSGTPTLSWEYTGHPSLGENPLAALGRSKPVYTGTTWDAAGRNDLELTNWEEWPSLPRYVCVVAVGGPGVDPVCTTQEAQCGCCDPGGDTAQFVVEATGCEGFAGTHRPISTRVCEQSTFETTYPGADWPTPSPCCVWPFTLGTGDGCTVDGVSYSGQLLVVIYCDGTDYQGDVYCYDTNLAEWVSKSNLSITWRCIEGCETFIIDGGAVTVCCTWTVSFAIPEMPCCCPPEDCCPCTDGDGRIIEVNFNSVSGCSLTGQTVMNSAATGCTFTLDGLNDGDCQISGGGSIECLPGGGFTLGATTNDGVVTPGTETDWSTGMTLTVNSCDPLDLEWTGPQGTVTAVEVP